LAIKDLETKLAIQKIEHEKDMIIKDKASENANLKNQLIIMELRAHLKEKSS